MSAVLFSSRTVRHVRLLVKSLCVRSALMALLFLLMEDLVFLAVHCTARNAQNAPQKNALVAMEVMSLSVVLALLASKCMPIASLAVRMMGALLVMMGGYLMVDSAVHARVCTEVGAQNVIRVPA